LVFLKVILDAIIYYDARISRVEMICVDHMQHFN